MNEFRVVHASSHEDADDVIFAHAAALALAGRGELVSLHAHTGTPWERPNLEQTLKQWGTSEQIAFQGVDHSCCEDPVETLLDGIRKREPNLVVAGTHQKHGFKLLMNGSVSQALVANATSPVLVLPIGGRGMVDTSTGMVGLKRILLPVGDDETADQALQETGKLLDQLEVGDVDIYLLHVGAGDVLESSLFPEHAGWRGHRLQRDGRLEDVILETCDELGIDLVVMPTRGPNSVKDVLFGTNTEHALKRSACPILTVPVAH